MRISHCNYVCTGLSIVPGIQRAINKIVAIALFMIKSTKVERGRNVIQTQGWVAPESTGFPGCALVSTSLKIYTVRC